jgi:hypothetical protein
MWICTKCERKFKSANQFHSCSTNTLESHFLRKPVEIKEIYEKLAGKLADIGTLQTSIVKSAIFLKKESTYLEIKVKNDYLLIAFYLDREGLEYPIVRTLQISKNRFVHVVHLYKSEDIDEQLIKWLTLSYQLIS